MGLDRAGEGGWDQEALALRGNSLAQGNSSGSGHCLLLLA